MIVPFLFFRDCLLLRMDLVVVHWGWTSVPLSSCPSQGIRIGYMPLEGGIRIGYIYLEGSKLRVPLGYEDGP